MDSEMLAETFREYNDEELMSTFSKLMEFLQRNEHNLHPIGCSW